jgi:ribosome-associated protein
VTSADAGYTVRNRKGLDSPLSSLEQARRVAALAQEKLAKDIVILDMRPVCTYTDFFVVCTGQNPRQTKAIFDEVYARLKQDDGMLPRSAEGAREATWIVADYLDLVLHVFTPEARSYYRLEELWGDVPSVEVEAVSA